MCSQLGAVCGGLIVAIGAQNAFVLRQGRRQNSTRSNNQRIDRAVFEFDGVHEGLK